MFLATSLGQIFGNSLPHVHNYNFPAFEMAPLGKRNQVNHNIYALSMSQLVYVMNFLGCFPPIDFSAQLYIHTHSWRRGKRHSVSENIHLS